MKMCDDIRKVYYADISFFLPSFFDFTDILWRRHKLWESDYFLFKTIQGLLVSLVDFSMKPFLCRYDKSFSTLR